MCVQSSFTTAALRCSNNYYYNIMSTDMSMPPLTDIAYRLYLTAASDCDDDDVDDDVMRSCDVRV